MTNFLHTQQVHTSHIHGYGVSNTQGMQVKRIMTSANKLLCKMHQAQLHKIS